MRAMSTNTEIDLLSAACVRASTPEEFRAARDVLLGVAKSWPFPTVRRAVHVALLRSETAYRRNGGDLRVVGRPGVPVGSQELAPLAEGL